MLHHIGGINNHCKSGKVTFIALAKENLTIIAN